MKQFPKVSVIVLNYNGKDTLDGCLASLCRVNYPDFSVVLVDNASTDGSFEAAKKKFSRSIFIRNESNLGFSAGNNIGIQFSLERGADYVVLLNNDTVVAENFLDELIRPMEKRPDAGIASPLILKGKSEEVWFSGGKIDWLRMKTIHFRDNPAKEEYESDFITGCAMVIKREVFLKIGMLDEDFFLYWEDADFSFRAKKAGFSNLIVPKVKIRHFEKSQEKKISKVYWLVVSGLIFFKKNASFWQKKWLVFYVFFRKMKNRRDVWMIGDEMSLSVQKAYWDFKQYERKKD